MRRRLAAALLAAGATACGGTTDPADPTPALGRYALAITHGGSAGAFVGHTYRGTLTLTRATRASLAGTVAAPELAPAIGDGAWQADAYRLTLSTTTSAPGLVLRVTRAAGSADLACDAVATAIYPGGLASAPATCALTYQGP